MSTTLKSVSELPLPSAEEADGTRLAVYNDVFFGKLAMDYGVVPATDEEAQELLKIAGNLRTLSQRPEVKQAQAAQSLILNAGRRLDQLMGNAEPTAVEKSAAINQIAANYLQHPDVLKAALSSSAASKAAA